MVPGFFVSHYIPGSALCGSKNFSLKAARCLALIFHAIIPRKPEKKLSNYNNSITFKFYLF